MRDFKTAWILLILLASLFCVTSCSDEAASDNTPPTVVLNPDTLEADVTVGSGFTVEVLAKDDDGDSLSFRYTTRVDNDLSTLNTAEWFPSDNNARFTWTPDSADVTAQKPIELVFIVEDSRGGYVDRKLLLNVLAGNGKPRFESSSNQLYKTCCDKPIEFDVKVRDDDSATVSISMEDSPKGAKFVQGDETEKVGKFSWKPTEEDAKKRVHKVTFEVDDKENEIVTQSVTIIIPPDDIGNVGIDATKKNADVCSVESFLTHTPPAPLRDKSKPPTFGIEATVSSGLPESYDTFFVRWYERLPDMKDGKDDEVRYTTDLTRQGDKLVGDLPNIINSAFRQEDALAMFYKICTTSPSPDKDGILCIPSAQGTYFSVNQYQEEDGKCLEESIENLSGNDDFDTTSRFTQSWDTYHLCEGNPDFLSITLKPGDKRRLLVSYSDQANVEFTLYDDSQTELPKSKIKESGCSGFFSVDLEVKEGELEQTFYLKMTGDETTFRVRAVDVDSAEQTCTDDNLETNDTVENATRLTSGQKIENGDICPVQDQDIFSIDLTTGQRLDAVLGFDSGANNFADLVVYKPSQRDEVLTNGSGHGSTFGFNEQFEPLEYGARECGTHYIRIIANDPSAVGQYTLEVEVAEDSCKDDDMFAAQCNHSITSAPFFSWNTTLPLALCSKGEDWLAHKGNMANVTAIVDGIDDADLSDTELKIFKKGETKPVAEAKYDRGEKNVKLDYTFPDDEKYYFVISSAKDIRYSLSVSQN